MRTAKQKVSPATNPTVGTATPIGKWWAVGLKGWVEIRYSPIPLRAHQSSVTLKVQPKKQPIEDFWGIVIGYDQPPPRNYKLTTKVWLGGQVVGRVRSGAFRSRAGFGVGNGKCEKISKSLMLKVLKKEG